MRKVIAAINMTLDGYCDHTAIIPDDQIHQYYTDLLKDGDTILYGRITYELMEFWKPFVTNPSGEQGMDDFAMAIDNIQKIVFSNTYHDAAKVSNDWSSASLAAGSLSEVVQTLKQKSGKHIYVGSRSLIIQLLKLQLIDELQICLHPVLVGKGLPLFNDLNDRIILKRIDTKTFQSGAIAIYYQPVYGNQAASKS